jgi:branched-chain amino acid transport system ATP-binding protein
MTTPLLALRDVDAHHGDLQALFGVSLEAREGDIVAIVGANAAGKSTTINVISGLVRASAGRVEFEGVRLDRLPPHHIVERGIVQIPEGRQLFPYMSVTQNLEMGAYTPAARERRHETLEEVFELLPLLRDRRDQLAVSLSGGEQQMCAIARGLMARPRLLMLDEPSLGLAPLFVQRCFDIVRRIHERGVTVLIVEQNVHHVLSLASRAYVLESGRVVMSGPGPTLLRDEGLRRAYMGM